MGLIHVTVTLRASQRSRKKYEAVFLVDTGATDCMAPASKLQRAGITRKEKLVWQGNLREEDVAAMCRERLRGPHRPEAIFCTNGATALGVLRGLRDCGPRSIHTDGGAGRSLAGPCGRKPASTGPGSCDIEALW